MQDLIDLDPSLFAQWNRPVPRYTSYPTAPQFAPFSPDAYASLLKSLPPRPLSLYLHIPFCKTMCLFCACSVVLNRNPVKQQRYHAALLQEISLVASHFPQKRPLSQLHFGGGTPTSLTCEELSSLLSHLKCHFPPTPTAELSIEVDPRGVFADRGEKLAHLRHLGFNRVSLGVQDFDPIVQEAVRRRQSDAVTTFAYEQARSLGFEGINFDLIYGLPHQTRGTFEKTVARVLELRPDRIALYSYAKVPWLKPHQKAIADEALPVAEEKFAIYVEARKRLMEGGYEAIGMDHFALKGDGLAKAYREGRLMRNFQGYSVELAEDLVGLGVSAIGWLGGHYAQNVKGVEEYEALVGRGILPVERGVKLHERDLQVRFVIQELMCHFAVDKGEFERRFGVPFEVAFERARGKIEGLKQEGLVEEGEGRLVPTKEGRLFIRLVAAAFDDYLDKGHFSRAV